MSNRYDTTLLPSNLPVIMDCDFEDHESTVFFFSSPHLNQRFKCAFLIICCSLSVWPSVCKLFTFFYFFSRSTRPNLMKRDSLFLFIIPLPYYIFFSCPSTMWVTFHLNKLSFLKKNDKEDKAHFAVNNNRKS